MNILLQTKNSLRGLLLRHGPATIKRWIWSKEFASGRWACLESMPNDCVIPYLNTLARGGSILDIGCGPGAIGEAIDPIAYRHYLGVDIADVAIEKARDNNSRSNNVYVQGDMRTFNPSGTYELILFGDSIYYFGFSDAKEILDRYSLYLNENGVFVMRCWVVNDRTRAIVKLIESDYNVTEKQWYTFRDPMLVIVFKPKIWKGQK
jgi:SAM-dependent methyltransferase